MNLKTTLILLTLIAAGGVGWFLYSRVTSEGPGSETVALLKEDLTKEKLTRVEVRRGKEKLVTLERAPGGEWTLPGKWPVRPQEVKSLVELLAGLHSRFAPVALAADKADLKKYGLADPPLTVEVQAGPVKHTLAFGEEPGEANRFSRPTYLRVDGKPEVLRLGPGLVAALSRPQSYYQQRRLFPTERVAKEEGGGKEERLAAHDLSAKGPDVKYTLARVGDDWEITEPTRDRPDPEKLRAVLAAVPDLWVEQFVDSAGKKPEGFGLKDPERTLRVTRPGGHTVTVLIGKVSREDRKKVVRPGPPSPFGPPKNIIDFVEVPYRYARLQDNDQVFEIKADKLDDIFVSLEKLRDEKLARFKPGDVTRVEVSEGGRELVFQRVKEKDKDVQRDRWKQVKPDQADTEEGEITSLLDKLSDLQAKGDDVRDKAGKEHGLDKPAATVKLAVEETKGTGDDKKVVKKYDLAFQFGKELEGGKKVWAQVQGYPRVNAVDEAVLKLAKRPAVAYRSRRLLRFDGADVARVEVERPGGSYALERSDGKWRLTAPAKAELDAFKAEGLPRDLGRLEAAEFVAPEPKAEDLDKLYGLAKPAATLKVTFADKKKAPEAVLLGKKREGKDEYYAKLGSAPAVFTVRKADYEDLTRDSLALLPTELWRIEPEDVAAMRVRKGDAEEYRLTKEGGAWKVSGPFSATASPELARPMAEGLATLRAERYVAHTAKDPAAYGLDKPYLRVTVEPAKKDGHKKNGEKGDTKERVLLVGKVAEPDVKAGKDDKDGKGKDGKGRYAKLADGEAVFVVGEKVVSAIDRAATDLLDRKLLALDPGHIQSVRTESGKGSFTLKKTDKGEWAVEAAIPFKPDPEEVDRSMNAWAALHAKEIVAWDNKALAPYGLDKPAATVKVTVRKPGEDGKPGKTEDHTLALGKEVEKDGGARYARLNEGPAVVVLPASTVADLHRTPLDLVNRSLLKLDEDRVTAVERRMGKDVVELVKKGTTWRLTKPADQPADQRVVADLVEELTQLRAKRVAAYPAKDLKPFGLDDPAATVTLRLEGDKGKAEQYVLHLGKPAEGDDGKVAGDRYARLDMSDTVVVLPGRLTDQLVAGPLEFRDRGVAKAPGVDRATVKRGARTATFAEVEADWKMIRPVNAEAQEPELIAFVSTLADLRADRLVAEKPGDLKPYGLDRPQARWEFQAEGKEVLTLLVGAREKGGRRAYAATGKGDTVFLLSERQTEQALAEYRGRKVWPPLDAAQIDRLTFASEKGSFTLQKVDGDWTVSGKPGAKVNAEAVRDTLDALGRLRAERYVADKDADLKLHGLDPAALTVEVDTPTGKRVLKVGGQEGGTGLYYGTVPGENGGAVFVLSEEDARRIVRPLSAFVAGKK